MSTKLDMSGQTERAAYDWYKKKEKIIKLLDDWSCDVIYGNAISTENVLEEILTIMNELTFDEKIKYNEVRLEFNKLRRAAIGVKE